jgi:alpha-tubulin suppressor-like RCC1 family protein
MKFQVCILIICSTLIFAVSCGDTDTRTISDENVTIFKTFEEAPGENCLNGGIKIVSGHDENGDGELTEKEILSTDYVCNGDSGYDGNDGSNGTDGANGDQPLVRTSVEPSGENCLEGGTKIETGMDENGNGELDDAEVDSTLTQYVCHGLEGADGQDVLVKTTNEPAGENCTEGGTKVEIGIDENGDGNLDEEEIDPDLTKYICNGQKGACSDNHVPEISEVYVDDTLYSGSALPVKPKEEITVKVKITDEDAEDAHSVTISGYGAEITGNTSTDVEVDEDGRYVFKITVSALGLFNFSIMVTDGCNIATGTVTMVSSNVKMTTVSAGEGHTCALNNFGAAYCWGKNNAGQLGNGSTDESTLPVAVNMSNLPEGKKFIAISAGKIHTCALDNDGKAYCWGNNTNGELGDNTDTIRLIPVAVNTTGALSGVVLTVISAGETHTCSGDGSNVYCWGGNSHGQLGNGASGAGVVSKVAVKVQDSAGDLGSVTNISSGGYHTCAWNKNEAGKAFCWGFNNYGQIGDNSSDVDREKAVSIDFSGVISGKTIAQISAGYWHTCAVDSDGKVYCWGHNFYKQTGTDSSGNDVLSPVVVNENSVLTGKTVVSVSTGRSHTCSVDDKGDVYCWGWNKYGQLGNGSTEDSGSLAVKVDKDNSALKDIKADGIYLGYDHSCAVSVTEFEGNVYCWGSNSSGQLGNGNKIDTNLSVEVK